MTEPVLVLRALGLGDALTGVPALRGLRRLHPGRPLVLAAPEVIGRWFTDLGLVDGYVVTSGLGDDPPGLGLGPHDAVNLHGHGPQSHALLLAGNPRSLLAFAPPESRDAGADASTRSHTRAPDDLPAWRADEHEVLRWCRLVGWAGGPCGPEDLRLEPSEPRPNQHGRRRSPGRNDGRAGGEPASAATPHTSAHDVVLHPGAASQSRRWPAERWAEVARLLGRRADVRVTGSVGERPRCTQIARAAGLGDDSVVAGDLDLPELLALVANAQLLVCGDTGVAHVATATGTPSVLLFGPTSPRLWGPAIDRDRHACLWHGVGNGDPHAEQTDPALLDITSVEVLAAAVALLDRDRGVA